MDHASRGEAALNAGKPEEAITHYNKALEQSPTAVPYYIKRSTAYQRTSNFHEALKDAETGVVLATKRAKRELIVFGQLRRGIALFQLEQYGDAGFVFGIVEKLDPKEKSIGIWQAKLKSKLQSLPEDDSKREVTVKEQPDVQAPAEQKAKPAAALTCERPNVKKTTTAATSAPTAQTSPSKIRHEWYQSHDKVNLTLLAKGVPKEATINIQANSVDISFPLVTGSSYDFSLDPLFAAIDPAASSYRVLGTKIEVVLHKAEAGHKWAALEGVAQQDGDATENTKPATGTSGAPAYPTSSRKGPKNWDKIAQSFTKPVPARNKPKSKSHSDSESDDSGQDNAKEEQKNRVQEIQAADEEDQIYLDDFDDEGDQANAFFKKIYKDADPDTRRAMMKSYQESGGTALSTSWSEVGKKKMEINPPDGMEAKKWEI